MGIVASFLGIVTSLTLSLSLGTERSTAKVTERTAHPARAIYTAVLKCKIGFKKGKTPVSLASGGKLSCVDVKLAAAGKRILTKGSCGACHSANGMAPYSTMNPRLFVGAYTLKPTSLKASFNAHAADMAGAVTNAAQIKSISAYLQTLAPPF